MNPRGSTPPPDARYGGQRAKRTMQLGPTFTANQSAPTTRNGFVNGLDNFNEVQWVIAAPSWCTAYHAHFMRCVEAGEGDEAVVLVLEDEDVNKSSGGDLVRYQYIVGQRVVVYLDGITGTPDPAEPFRVLYTGVNR